MPYRFFIRSNAKAYANPLTRKDKWKEIIKKLNIKVLPMDQLPKYPGIVFCVDGDIYGPAAKFAHTSILPKLDRKKFLIISLTENFNFRDSYPTYKKWIDYVVVQNVTHRKMYRFDPQQALILGVPKFDIKFSLPKIYKRHKLDPKAKYVVIFYPRFDRGRKRFGPKFDRRFAQLYIWLRSMGFKILVKNREKLGLKDKLYHGHKYFEDSRFYPNISMELLEVAKLAIFFGSAVIEEVVMSRTPYVEFVFDKIDRFSFLRSPAYGYTIESTTWPSETTFKKKVSKLIKVKSEAFDHTIKTCMFQGEGCAARILDKSQKLATIKFRED